MDLKAMLVPPYKKKLKESIRMTFFEMDTDNDGFVSMNDLVALFPMSDKEKQIIAQGFELDGEGMFGGDAVMGFKLFYYRFIKLIKLLY
jgi:hypothetical protein